MQPTTVSAVAAAFVSNVTTWRREFQRLAVNVTYATGEAVLEWK